MEVLTILNHMGNIYMIPKVDTPLLKFQIEKPLTSPSKHFEGTQIAYKISEDNMVGSPR